MTNCQSSTPDTCLKARDLLLSLMEVDNPFESATSGSAAVAPTALTAAEQTFLNEHLFRCKACRIYHSDMQRLAESFDALDDLPVPDGLADRIMARIDFGAIHPDTREASGFETEKHLHDVPDTAIASTTNSPPRIGGAPSNPQGRPFIRLMAPVAAAVFLIALAAPQVNQWMNPAPSTSKDVARVTLPNSAARSNASSGVTSNQLAALPNAISASQTPAPNARSTGAERSSNAVVALVPKPISPKGAVTGSNNRAASSSKGTVGAPKAAMPSAAKKQTPAATKPQAASRVVIASIPPQAFQSFQSLRHSAKTVSTDSIDGQEVAYDPVTHLFGPNWAVDEFGNAVASDATSAKQGGGDELATSATRQGATASEVVDDSNGDDPLSSLVGF